MSDDMLQELRKAKPFDFEHLIADLWEQMGYQTDVIQQSNDKGIDVQAIDQLGEKYLIQVKRHGPDSTISGPQIREYSGLYLQEDGVDRVYVVTTNEFTQQANQIAEEVGVKLINGDQLVRLIKQHDRESLLKKYLSDPQSTGIQNTKQTTHSISGTKRIDIDDLRPNDEFKQVNLRGADLNGIELYHATLTGSDLCGASLHSADLHGTNFSHAELKNADLRSANLRGSNFYQSNLKNANLHRADISCIKGEGLMSTFTDGDSLKDADLRQANLSGADLSDADLTKADLSESDLSGADLTDANLTDADLSGADMEKTVLQGADLSNADIPGK